MSKTALKKELSTFTGEELVKVILDVYDVSKEAKQYFEYFLHPNPDALLEKKVDIIAKEINRAKRGYCKARISRIRAEIKEFESYGVGAEYVCRLMGYTLRMLTGEYAYVRYTDALLASVRKFTAENVVYANKHEMLSQMMSEINSLDSSQLGTPNFRRMVLNAATEAMENLASGMKK